MVSWIYSEFKIWTGVTLNGQSGPTAGKMVRRFKSHGFRCHRLRHENLHNFEKNLDQNGLL